MIIIQPHSTWTISSSRDIFKCKSVTSFLQLQKKPNRKKPLWYHKRATLSCDFIVQWRWIYLLALNISILLSMFHYISSYLPLIYLLDYLSVGFSCSNLSWLSRFGDPCLTLLDFRFFWIKEIKVESYAIYSFFLRTSGWFKMEQTPLSKVLYNGCPPSLE